MAASQLESATPRIIDFDFSQSSEELERHILATTTQRLVVGGTEGFIAPEIKQAVQANRMPLITPAIDVYALSCTIALLLNQGSVLAIGGGTGGAPNAVSSEAGAIQELLKQMGREDPANRPDMRTVNGPHADTVASGGGPHGKATRRRGTVPWNAPYAACNESAARCCSASAATTSALNA